MRDSWMWGNLKYINIPQPAARHALKSLQYRAVRYSDAIVLCPLLKWFRQVLQTHIFAFEITASARLSNHQTVDYSSSVIERWMDIPLYHLLCTHTWWS